MITDIVGPWKEILRIALYECGPCMIWFLYGSVVLPSQQEINVGTQPHFISAWHLQLRSYADSAPNGLDTLVALALVQYVAEKQRQAPVQRFCCVFKFAFARHFCDRSFSGVDEILLPQFM